MNDLALPSGTFYSDFKSDGERIAVAKKFIRKIGEDLIRVHHDKIRELYRDMEVHYTNRDIARIVVPEEFEKYERITEKAVGYAIRRLVRKDEREVIERWRNSKAHREARKMLLEKCRLDAVISMPSGVFKPYAGVQTAVLIFQKGEPTEKVWFYKMEADGYSLDDKRNATDDNDIPDIIEKFENRNEQDNENRKKKHFFVPISEIRENDFDLTVSRYKEDDYEEPEYEKPSVLKDKILKLEEEIVKDLKELGV